MFAISKRTIALDMFSHDVNIFFALVNVALFIFITAVVSAGKNTAIGPGSTGVVHATVSMRL